MTYMGFRGFGVARPRNLTVHRPVGHRDIGHWNSERL